MSQYNNYGSNSYYSGGGGGGGGYLQNNSPFSANATPSGVRRSEMSHSLRPVTIGQLIRATQTHTDAEWVINTVEVGQVTVVAQVVEIKNQTTNCMYILDDGSGRIEARYWIDSSETESGKVEAVVEHTYVRVTGSVKSFGNKRYINATHMHVCKDPHEVIFHTMEAMTVSLIMERGSPSRPNEESRHTNGSGVESTRASAYSNQQSSVSLEQFAGLPDVERRIAEFMAIEEKKLENTPEAADGIHVGAIARAVGGEAGKISSALDHLMDGGLIFTTSDESHFKLAT